MSAPNEISKTYEPASIEAKWYAYWLAEGCFHADPASAKPAYSIVIPPPNVTGVLTLGHVLNTTIQDILARRARMTGHEVLWLPGTDHAGIATQTVVERTLKKQGVIRHRDDLGREKFLEKVWEWKDKHGGIIIQQLKKLGCSCDWARERFTMDPEYSRCVSRVFVDLYKKGLIYRGKRMVNWCPASLTALSDEEVVMKPQNGTMYHFKVEVVSSSSSFSSSSSSSASPPTSPVGRDEDEDEKTDEEATWLTIATTRPETIPGDTAIAVNPNDPRYAHLIGRHVRRPLPRETPEAQKLIPIIGDEHVDFAFGTGVLKVTPAHDKADFEIGQRHGLAVVDIMQPNGTMNALAGEALAGLDRFEARSVAVEQLRNLGVLVKEEPYQNNVGYSERADVPIEPRLSEQWFLKYPSVEQARGCVSGGAHAPSRAVFGAPAENLSPSGEAALQPAGNGAARSADESSAGAPTTARESACAPQTQMRFYPERWAKVYDHWLGGIQDWCISRQLWWGHRVPVWYRGDEVYCGNDAPEGDGFTQDPDVLDTWFSSWLWPFATMGWPEKTGTLAKFYPTTDLVTGPDIIFFWVARMIMAGFEYMGELPFRNVYFTGIIRDKQGRKMSKSLGNSPDPLDLIAKFGADALRFGVMRSAPLGSDILFDDKNVELGRNFCTKLWNAARFRQMQGGETEGEIAPGLLTSDDKWILLRLDAAVREVTAALDEYRFSDAAQGLYRFFWTEYCDWYLEASKASLPSPFATEAAPPDATADARKANTLAVMDYVFAHTLRLMHPFLPFITEELWNGLGFASDLPDAQGGRTIMFAPWPKPLTDVERAWFELDESDAQLAAAKQAVVEAGRGLRRDFKLASNQRLRFVLRPSGAIAAHEVAVLKLLLNAEPLEIADAGWTPAIGTPAALTPLGELFLPLDGLIDVAAERERMTREIAKVEDELAKVRAKLGNPAFAEKVPATVLAEHRQREATWVEKLAQLQRLRDALGAS